MRGNRSGSNFSQNRSRSGSSGRGGGSGGGGGVRRDNRERRGGGGGGGDEGGEERVHMDRLFRSSRQEHFHENITQRKLQESRQLRDEEAKRMEAYRKLCAQEGIQSKRVEEYDRQKQQNAQSLGEALNDIESNTQMSHKERKQAKFLLKRKASARSSELLPAVRSVGAVLAAKAQKIGASREELAARKEAEIKERIETKEEKLRLRQKKAKAFALKTKSGQPVMAGRVRNLLEKVMRQSQS